MFAFYLQQRIWQLVLTFFVFLSRTNVAVHGVMLRHWRGGFVGDPGKFPTLQREYPQRDYWFDQRLDHFQPNSGKNWKQRYFVNIEHYRNDSQSPIFLLIGGEAEAAKKWMHEGSWIHYAEHFGALCFYLEHRFYGKSHPTSDLSTSNLRYLTSEQALEDLAAFVRYMKAKYRLHDTQKWIAFGGSYPGSLAAWAREKYPELINGAISSSGPLLAKVDFKEYYEVVINSLNNFDIGCVEAVKKSFAEVEILLKHMIGQRNLDEKFKTCTSITNSINNQFDISNFFEALASNFAGVVQYNKDNSPRATISINEVCDVMLNTSLGPPVTRLAKVNEMILKEDREECLDFKYDKMIKAMQKVEWSSESANGSRQWTWQTCNEFGFYQTSEQDSHVFGQRFNVNFFIQQCMDIYGSRMNFDYLNEMVEKTNEFYGGLNPKSTNVLYVHGSIDPWHALGLTKTENINQPTVYIEGTAHCADMYEPLATDPPQLISARNQIITYLANLLNQYRTF